MTDQLHQCGRLTMQEKSGKNGLIRTAVVTVSIAASVGVIVLAVLQILKIYTDAINIFMPLMGVTQLCQAYLQWNSSRKVAYFSLGTAVFIFICATAVFFLN